jgi:GntR family transcriptional regulator, gluconate operon transcriptional repressor
MALHFLERNLSFKSGISYANLLRTLGVTDLPVTGMYKIAHETLKQQAWEILRDLIVRRVIVPGQKLTERDVAKLLGIGRMPARDALMKLEEQGLVVTKPGARYVIELNERDIENWFEIRQALEGLSVKDAVLRQSMGDRNRLRQALEAMSTAIEQRNQGMYVQKDLEIHELIWNMSGNRQLIDMLRAMIGPIFVLIASQTNIQHDWDAVFNLHARLVEAICSGDSSAAIEAMQQHNADSLAWSLAAFRESA